MIQRTIILLIFLSGTLLQAQQLRYVDTDYILSKFPQYTQAKAQLQQQVNAWKTEIEQAQDEIDQMVISLENEKVILTDDKIAERQEAIDEEKSKLKEKIDQKFGVNGASQQLRENLVKPLRDQIWNTINSIAQSKNYHMIFDKAGGANLIYADEKYDITEMVIKELGLDELPESKPTPRTPVNNRNNNTSKKIKSTDSVQKAEEQVIKK